MTFKDFIPPIVYNNLSDFFGNSSSFIPGGSNGEILRLSSDSWNGIDYLNSFETIPEINGVISLKARAFSNMRVKAVDQDGNELDTPEVQKFLALLSNPNWFQEFQEFLIQTKTFREIFGNEYIYSQVPFGFNANLNRVKQIFTLPPNITRSIYSSDIPFYLADDSVSIKYLINSSGIEKELNPLQVIHLNDNRAFIKSSNDKNLLNGESKMKALTVVINNIKMAYESRGVILKYRGADGAWVNKSKDAVGQSLPLKPEDKEELQRANNKYGTLRGQYQTIVTRQDLAWVQAGIKNPANLGLFEEIQEDFYKICDSYGTPVDLFAAKERGSTFENQKQAEKGLYMRTIIPEANEWIGSLRKQFFPDGKVSLIADYNHLPILQEDLKARADAFGSAITALSKALSDDAITIEQYQDELDKYGIKKISNQN